MHFCSYVPAQMMFTKALTAILLFLFSTEFVALASSLHDNVEKTGAQQYQLVAHEVSATLSLLAEENENRDQRDEILLPFEREVLHPHVFPPIARGKINWSVPVAKCHHELPLYTFHRTLLI